MVGQERRFYVHERVVRSNSTYLNEAFQRVWVDNHRCRTVSFSDLEPDLFNGYLSFLYGMLEPQVCSDEDHYLYLARLYGFGEEIKDRRFQGAVLDQIIYESRKLSSDGMTQCPGTTIINFVYDTTPKGSPARRLMVDFAVCYGKVNWELSKKGKLPREYLLDVINAFFGMNTSNETEKKRKGLESGVPVAYHHLTINKSEAKSTKPESTGESQKDKKNGDGRAVSA